MRALILCAILIAVPNLTHAQWETRRSALRSWHFRLCKQRFPYR